MQVEIDLAMGAHANSRKYHLRKKQAKSKEQKTKDVSKQVCCQGKAGCCTPSAGFAVTAHWFCCSSDTEVEKLRVLPSVVATQQQAQSAKS